MIGKRLITNALAALSGGKIGKLLWRKQRLLGDIKAMSLLPPLNIPFVPWSSSAAQPLAVNYMLNEIVINGRRKVLELGSGISTLYLATVLSRHGGTLLTVDHDENWLAVVESYLEQMDIPKDTVRVCHAPIKDFETKRFGDLPWYDAQAVRSSVSGDSFDMLVVDGPEAWMKTARYARYPALPLLSDALSADAVVFLDDIDRKGERRILKHWAGQYSYKAQLRPEASVGILRKTPEASYNIF